MIEFLLNLIPGVNEDENEDDVTTKRPMQVVIAVIVFAIIVAVFVFMG